MMVAWSPRSTCSLLFTAACFLHNPASAEAYSSLAAQRSSLWSRTSKGSDHVCTQNTVLTNSAEKMELSSGRVGPRLPTMLRSGGEGEITKRFWNKQFARELLAEMIGTGLIVQIGTGAVMSAIFCDALVGLFQIASVWIIAVTLAIATTGCISGAHLNPAISISFALLRPSSTFGWAKVIPFCVAQLAGAILGSLVSLFLYASKIREFEAANNIVRGAANSVASAKAFGEYFDVGTLTAFCAEAFGTAILAFVIFSLTHPKNDASKNNVYIPPLIGATVGGLIAVIAPLTQAGFNPARDFGPRIIAWLAGWKAIAFRGWWVYVTAPIVGAPIGAFVADKLLYGEE